MITVKELISLLQKEDEDRVVIIYSKQNEGDLVSPLNDIITATYIPLDDYVGIIEQELFTKDGVNVEQKALVFFDKHSSR